MLNNNQLIIFDCDGVLVDSEIITMRVLSEMIPELSEKDAYIRFRGKKIASCLEEIEKETSRVFSDNFVQSFRSECLKQYIKHLKSSPNLRPLVESLNGRYCVATSAPREKVESMLKAVEIFDLFSDRIFSAYELGVWKPSPDIFLTAAESYGVSCDNCIVVEDSPTGVAAALAANMHTLVYDPRNEAVGESFKNTHRFSDMNELPSLIKNWQNTK